MVPLKHCTINCAVDEELPFKSCRRKHFRHVGHNVACYYNAQSASRLQERPYHSDSTASRLLSEVKHCRARLVLRWGTTLESLVLFFCFFASFFWCMKQRHLSHTTACYIASLPFLLHSSILLCFSSSFFFCCTVLNETLQLR